MPTIFGAVGDLFVLHDVLEPDKANAIDHVSGFDQIVNVKGTYPPLPPKREPTSSVDDVNVKLAEVNQASFA